MRFSILAIMSLMVVGSASVAAPLADFVPAPNQRFVIDLDSQDGAYSEWQAVDLTGLSGLRGDVKFARAGKDKRWSPVFYVRLANAKESIAVRAVAIDGVESMVLERRLGTDIAAEKKFLAPPVLGEAHALEIDWARDGTVRVGIRTKASRGEFERYDMKMAAPPTQLEISSSTGEVKIDNLQLGRSGV